VTASPPRRLPAPPDADAALERIRSHGGRVTPAKRGVIDLLYGDGTPRTAEEVAAALPGIDRSVVYRCLGQLEELGIAHHVHLGHGRAVYRRAGGTDVPVACQGCGATSQLDLGDVEAFRSLVLDRTGIELDLVHFPLSGRCEACRAASAEGGDAG
jgi:Fur family ferric uptake transcriptional regulator